MYESSYISSLGGDVYEKERREAYDGHTNS
jgi:lactate dehydrogenase-like 2-hydroxyacid dehydrogenase